MRTAVLLLIAGCTGSETVVGPTIVISAPEDGETVCGTPMQVELDITDFELVAMGGEATDGAGHVDFTMNGQTAAMSQEPSFEVQVPDPGTYVIRAELVHADHTPLDPPMADEIQIEVDASACGAAE